MISNELTNNITRRLVESFHPQKIILFGSQARETADPRSDIDILVVCPFKGKRRHLMVEMDEALGDLEHAFDIVILTPEEFQRDSNIPGTIGRYAHLEGRILYAQSLS